MPLGAQLAAPRERRGSAAAADRAQLDQRCAADAEKGSECAEHSHRRCIYVLTYLCIYLHHLHHTLSSTKWATPLRRREGKASKVKGAKTEAHNLGVSWAILGPSWAILGPSWGHLGASRGHLGAILGPSGAILGPSWGHLGSILGPSWVQGALQQDKYKSPLCSTIPGPTECAKR